MHKAAVQAAEDEAFTICFSNQAIARSAVGDWHGVHKCAEEAIHRPGGMGDQRVYSRALS